MEEEKKLYRFDVKLDIETVLDPYPLNSILTKNVTIVSSLYQNNQTGFSIYVAKEEDVGQFKISGVFPAPLIIHGEYEIKGYVSIYKGEKQITCKSYKLKPPTMKESIKEHISKFENIYAHVDAIYDSFKEDTLKVLRNSPDLIVQKIPGIDITYALKWQASIKEEEEIDAAMVSLTALGLGLRDSRSILQKYGSGVIYKLREDPYFLIGDIPSMTFNKCDKIAIESGYELDSLGRGQQAIVYVLESAAFDGNCYKSKDELFEECKKLLTFSINYNKCKELLKQNENTLKYNIGKSSFNIKKEDLLNSISLLEKSYKKTGIKDFEYILFTPTDELLETSFEILIKANKVFVSENKCYLYNIFQAENYISEKIYKIAHNITDFPINDINMVDRYLKNNRIVLEKNQYKAVRDITDKMGGFFILNGGPGCGKTFVTKIIIAIITEKYNENNLNFSVKLLAPTGKASKVLRDATGLDAYTIHKGLEFKEDEVFLKNEDNPFIEDVVIVDESSMLDVLMTKNLLEAISNNTKVIFVGDIDQLPPIGPGCVLKDLIKSEVLSINTLTVSKRQLSKSNIISNAKNIASGEMIKSDINRRDFIVLKKESEMDCKDAILKGIKELIDKQKLSINDIQVLTPQKSGILGSNSLNYYIQELFNPKKDNEEEVFKQKSTIKDSKSYKNVEKNVFFRIGDKVIHIKNNYTKDWYVKDKMLGFRKEFSYRGITNGESGVIVNIEKINELGVKRERITVEYDGGYIFYDDDYSELEHAFALTIHKSQGSQWPAVLVPILIPKKANKSFYTNNLIYTACTRCKKVAIVIGSPDDIYYAIKNKIENDRNTSLSESIRNNFKKNNII